MNPFNKNAMWITAGIAGAVFVGYCIYFDKQRRSDPEYKKKVRERRRRNREIAEAAIKTASNPAAMQRYFTQEMQLGEALIARGELENGVEHLANAIVVCDQPGQLLHLIQASVPANVFAMLIYKLQEIGNRANIGRNTTPLTTEAQITDDLE